MRIFVVGFLICFAGALLEVPEDTEFLSSIFLGVGQFIAILGIFVCFLGAIEGNMHK